MRYYFDLTGFGPDEDGVELDGPEIALAQGAGMFGQIVSDAHSRLGPKLEMVVRDETSTIVATYCLSVRHDGPGPLPAVDGCKDRASQAGRSTSSPTAQHLPSSHFPTPIERPFGDQ